MIGIESVFWLVLTTFILLKKNLTTWWTGDKSIFHYWFLGWS